MAKDKPVIYGNSSTKAEKRAERYVRDGRQHENEPPHAFIPGYWEQVKANDISTGVADVSGGEKTRGITEDEKQELYSRFGTEPAELPYHFQFVRTMDRTGNENAAVVKRTRLDYEQKGYRPAKEEDFEPDGKFGKLGYEIPPDAEVLGDGTIRRIDTTLYYTEGDNYRRLEREKRVPEKKKRPDVQVYEEERGEKVGPAGNVG